ncbi:hypothetical protein [Spirochaeta dissipatitropha]
MNKYVTAVIVAALLLAGILLTGGFYLAVIHLSNAPIWLAAVVAVGPIVGTAAVITAFVLRIKELKKEKEDDYSKY